jgi:hypothetical protein
MFLIKRAGISDLSPQGKQVLFERESITYFLKTGRWYPLVDENGEANMKGAVFVEIVIERDSGFICFSAFEPRACF